MVAPAGANPTTGHNTGQTSLPTDSSTDRICALWQDFKETASQPMINFLEFKEKNPWPLEAFKKVYGCLGDGVFEMLLVCKGWARDGFEQLVKIQNVRMDVWMTIAPRVSLYSKKTEVTLRNVAEFGKIFYLDLAAINADLTTYSLDELHELQMIVSQKSNIPYEGSFTTFTHSIRSSIPFQIIVRAIQSLAGKKITAEEHQPVRQIVTRQWAFLLNNHMTLEACRAARDNFFLPDEWLEILREHISTVDTLAIFPCLIDRIKNISSKNRFNAQPDPAQTLIVQQTLLKEAYLRWITIGRLDHVVQHAKNQGNLDALCRALYVENDAI